MTELVLDTSTLSCLVDGTIRERLVHACRTGRDELVVPIVALGECLEDPDVDAAEGRAAAIADVVERVDGRLGMDPAGLLKCEWRGRTLSRTPRLQPEWQERALRENLRLLPRAGGAQMLKSLEAYHGKADTLAMDEAARAGMPRRFPGMAPAHLRQFMEDLPGYILGAGNPLLLGITRSRRHRKRARAHPERFRATLMLAAYYCLNGLGAAFTDVKYDRYHGVLKKPQPGSWVDARIAACAVYGDVLLTEDRNQAAKVNFIAEAFGWSLRARRLQEHLESAAAAEASDTSMHE